MDRDFDDAEAHPVSRVQWVPTDEVSANDYNPNAVAPPEMDLLELSIRNDGFTQPIDLNNIFETLRYVDMKKHPEHAIPLLPAMVRIFPKLEGLPGIWLFTGARWGNIGLIKATGRLGKDARPIIAAMKTMLPELETRPKKDRRNAKQFTEIITTVKKTIADYEAKYGNRSS